MSGTPRDIRFFPSDSLSASAQDFADDRTEPVSRKTPYAHPALVRLGDVTPLTGYTVSVK